VIAALGHEREATATHACGDVIEQRDNRAVSGRGHAHARQWVELVRVIAGGDQHRVGPELLERRDDDRTVHRRVVRVS
jgi:hypothetical protein